MKPRINKLSESLFSIDGVMWSKTKMRKGHRCRICTFGIVSGELAFSPLTNGESRMERICLDCVSKLHSVGGG